MESFFSTLTVPLQSGICHMNFYVPYISHERISSSFEFLVWSVEDVQSPCNSALPRFIEPSNPLYSDFTVSLVKFLANITWSNPILVQ